MIFQSLISALLVLPVGNSTFLLEVGDQVFELIRLRFQSYLMWHRDVSREVRSILYVDLLSHLGFVNESLANLKRGFIVLVLGAG